MLLICIPMMRSMHKRNDSEAASSEEVAELRGEIARLKTERTLADTKETLDD